MSIAELPTGTYPLTAPELSEGESRYTEEEFCRLLGSAATGARQRYILNDALPISLTVSLLKDGPNCDKFYTPNWRLIPEVSRLAVYAAFGEDEADGVFNIGVVRRASKELGRDRDTAPSILHKMKLAGLAEFADDLEDAAINQRNMRFTAQGLAFALTLNKVPASLRERMFMAVSTATDSHQEVDPRTSKSLARLWREFAIWHKEAACKGQEIDGFFPPKDKQPLPKIQALCQDCKVSDNCAEFGSAFNSVGYWGGLTRAQRKAEGRKKNRL